MSDNTNYKDILVEEEDLVDLSSGLNAETWKNFGRRIGVKEREIKNIDTELTIHEKFYKVLYHWREINGDRPSLYLLKKVADNNLEFEEMRRKIHKLIVKKGGQGVCM